MGASFSNIQIMNNKIKNIEMSYTDFELSYHEYQEIKKTMHDMSDTELIKCIQYLKIRGISLTSDNTHIWKVCVNWANKELT